jgi:branched-chain amino acid transport system permease protein
MEKFLTALISGVLLGGIYALTAMGLSIQYGVARVLNMAHGEFIMFSAFLAWLFYTSLHINPMISLVIVGLIMFIVGYLLYWTFFRHILNSRQIFGEITIFGILIAWMAYRLSSLVWIPIVIFIGAFALDIILSRYVFKRKAASMPSIRLLENNSLLAAFGFSFIIMNIALATWTGAMKGYNYLRRGVDIVGVLVEGNRLLAFGFAVVIGLAFYLFLVRTRIGKAIRAAAQDPTTAGLMGVNINRLLALCFALGAMMAGFAGVLISICLPINATMGQDYVLIAIVVVVLGGLGSIPGSFIGGFILGIIGSFVTTYKDPLLSTAAYYVIFMLLLLLRPKGILGK